ncbi:MAG: hypothetical protein H6872_04615 [Methylobacteriaceae bacterium]|nr:hypothetical protein [Methylobacteriaceae bacterium]
MAGRALAGLEKEALIARIAARIHQPPENLPAQPQWAALRPDDYDYRHVRARGHYLPGEILIYDAVPRPL